MKITNVKIKNVGGVINSDISISKGVLPLCGKNGVGKTSIINAIRYCCTGAEPDSTLVTKGAGYADVQITFDDGDIFARRKYAKKGRSSVCYINNEQTTIREGNLFIAKKTGMSADMLDMLMFSEVLGSLKEKDFTNILLANLPEELNVQSVLDMIPEKTKRMEQIIRDSFPGKFIPDEMQRFYKDCYQKRRDLRKELGDMEAKLDVWKNTSFPSETKEVLEKEIANTLKKREVYQKAAQAYAVYLHIQEERKNTFAKYKKRMAEYKENYMGLPPYNPEMEASLEKELSRIEKDLSERIRDIAKLEGMNQQLKSAIETLDRPICPLHKSLVCKTDKSGVRYEAEKTLAGYEQLLQESKYKQDSLVKEKSEAEKRLQEVRASKSKAEYKLNLEKELIDLKNTFNSYEISKAEPVDPKVIHSLEENLKELYGKASAIESKKEMEKISAQAETVKLLLQDYEALCMLFDEKGPVRKGIVNSYLKAYTDICNEISSEAEFDTEFSFEETYFGIQVLTRRKERAEAEYLPFKDLSGGEKVTCLFVLMSMFAKLSGVNIMIFDELSQLDPEAFEKMICCIDNHKDDYDLIVVSATDHNEIKNTMNKHGLISAI